jgi:hypothetical protein
VRYQWATLSSQLIMSGQGRGAQPWLAATADCYQARYSEIPLWITQTKQERIWNILLFRACYQGGAPTLCCMSSQGNSLLTGQETYAAAIFTGCRVAV